MQCCLDCWKLEEEPRRSLLSSMRWVKFCCSEDEGSRQAAFAVDRRKAFCLASVVQPPTRATVILSCSLSFRWAPLLKATRGQSLCTPVGSAIQGLKTKHLNINGSGISDTVLLCTSLARGPCQLPAPVFHGAALGQVVDQVMAVPLVGKGPSVPTFVQLCWNGCGSRAGEGTLHLVPSDPQNHRAV